MSNLVTRFHLLLFTVTLAITGVSLMHIPADFAFAAHWRGSSADWLWPRDVALAVAPLVQLGLMAAFFSLGRTLTKNHMAKTRHILDPALTLLLSVAAGCQLGLLLFGIGSDVDMFRITTGSLAATLLVLAVIIYEAERHSYGGLRMPWPIPSDRAWTFVHRASGGACALAAFGLAYATWADPGAGILLLLIVASLVGLPLIASFMTLLARLWR